MGLYVRRDEQRSKLQERIAADLRAKSKQASEDIQATTDLVEDSNYMQDTKTSSGLLGVWLVIGVVAFGLIIALIVRSS